MTLTDNNQSVDNSNPSGPVDAFEEWAAKDLLQWAVNEFGGRMGLVTSFQAEGMVILDMLVNIEPKVRVITIDTGRLHEETYGFMEEVRRHYGVQIEVHFPDSREVRELVSKHGVNLFYHNVDSRQACCEVRKVKPLEHILEGLDAWVTGLRREQSSFRLNTRKIEIDHKNGGIVKINPLADWSEQEVKAYQAGHDVPRHPLYSRGYTSIGCAPCTRPSNAGEHSRAGRWWWEDHGTKECGLHCRL